ncbi:DnaD domain protein [Salinicoccus roseus]|uniref:DnaD domain protein n=1 Tax=Salinicoccus roseus TaxID=45670 RepID=UPI0035239363
MSSNKRYYWLKLNENFFEDDTMSWLEEQENGKDYIIFYLKLCLKSLSDDGHLVRYVGEKLIPYDVNALSRLTDTNKDTVRVAMKLFLEIGLIDQMDSGEIYMTQINEMIGSETDSARRMRKKRIQEENRQKSLPSHCDTNVQKSDTEKEIETELELEKDIDTEKDKETDTDTEKERVGVVFDKYTELGFGAINAFKAEQLSEWLKTFEPEVVVKSLEVASNNNKATMNYVNGILNNWKQRGLTTLEKVEAEEKRKQVEQMKPSYQQRRREKPGEVTPLWMKEEKKSEQSSGPAKTAGEDPEIQKMIAEFRNGG